MGGYGSGRRWGGGKETTSDYRRLDIRWWHREGLLVPGRSSVCKWTRNGEVVALINVRTEADRVVLSYRQRRNGEAWKSEEYPVFLDWTPCNYGGQRAWFLCPARGCGRRAAVLYGGAIFACRHCHQLAYESQRESVNDRALRRHQDIRMRLGGSGSTLEPFPTKPEGMHWRTYHRLCGEAEETFRRSVPDWLLRQIASHL
jgi:hypothetical protein